MSDCMLLFILFYLRPYILGERQNDLIDLVSLVYTTYMKEV